MNLKTIKELIEMMESSQLSKLEIKENDFEIKMCKVQEEVIVNTNRAVAPIMEDKIIVDRISINAPVVGTFYTRPASDKEPFVKVGQKINVGDTVCIIEAMKVMSEITADKAGTIVEVLGENGQLVEFDQPLFVLE